MTFIATNASENVLMSSLVGETTAFGLGGNDFMRGDTDSEELYGGSGDDLMAGHDFTHVNGAGTVADPYTYDAIITNSGSDWMFGDEGSDVIYGGDGDDILSGGEGSESGSIFISSSYFASGLWGGDGNDVIYGDEGNDDLFGENGNDRMYGGTENDKLVPTGCMARVAMTFYKVMPGAIRWTAARALTGCLAAQALT
jgi:serralysin